jgi:hypothetical protein
MRVSRPKYSELSGEERKKVNARAYANVYQRRGKIERHPCYVCLSPRAEKHHEDYDKPLQVRWICRKCHVELHRNDGKAVAEIFARVAEIEKEEKELGGT